jgi:pyruvate dehydrogenase E2 component (dihydrolipoamide acetyltransferase)
MVSELAIPVMDQTTVSVNLTHWLKREGDAVAEGEAVCEIETDKATVEVPAPAAGMLRKILVPAGTEIPPRTVVALIAAADEALPEIDPYYRTEKAAAQAPAPAAPTPAATARAASAKVIVSPRARRLAEEHHLDLSTVTGTGPGGRILEEDVQEALAHAPAAPPAKPAASRAAQTKAERVSRSWQTIPHFYLTITVDLTHLTARKAAEGASTTFTDYFALALGRLLPSHPGLNGFWNNDTSSFEPAAEVRLGLVVEAEHGLVIPALADLRGRALAAVAAERAQVVAQARAGKLPASALAVPTFTLSNVGPGHIDHFTAIISTPQVAILTVGSVQLQPLVVGAEVLARPAATFTLGVDHRALDGRQAARFLEDLKRDLETFA